MARHLQLVGAPGNADMMPHVPAQFDAPEGDLLSSYCPRSARSRRIKAGRSHRPDMCWRTRFEMCADVFGRSEAENDTF
jgi:hypothetical protein